MVDVKDVAESIYKVSTKIGFHGKNYLLSSESYKTSDISLMLNKKEPKNKSHLVYSNSLIKQDLDVNFKPAKEFLNEFE